MRYIGFIIILSLLSAGYYLYSYDKTATLVVQKDTLQNYTQLLTENFWFVATLEDVKVLVRDRKLETLVNPDNQMTALHYAVIYGTDERVIPVLVNAGVNPVSFFDTKEPEEPKSTALHMAVIRDKKAFEFTKELLKYYPDIDIRDQDISLRATPLIWATYNTSASVIKLLLDHKANVNAKTVQGLTPLMALFFVDEGKELHTKATTEEYIEIAKLLLTYKADINIKDENGLTALDYMEQNEKVNKTDFFKELQVQKK